MSSSRLSTEPTLARLARVLPAYGARFDVTLEEAREAIGPQCDPSNPDHAEQLRVWLNIWTCRIRVPSAGEVDPFTENLSHWWIAVEANLPTSRHG